MSWPTILLIIAFTIFAAYNIYILIVCGIPSNISVTYYHLENKHAHLGLVFPCMMFLLCATMSPTWLYISRNNSCQTLWTQSLIYVTLLGTMTLSILANYKKSHVRTIIHYLAAILAAISAVTWIAITDWQLIYIPVIVVLLISFAAFLTHTLVSRFYYWLELATIYTVQISLFVLSIRL